MLNLRHARPDKEPINELNINICLTLGEDWFHSCHILRYTYGHIPGLFSLCRYVAGGFDLES